MSLSKKIIFLIGLLLVSCAEPYDDFDLDDEGNWLLSLFSSCICIGDSVTEGHVIDYPSTPEGGVIDRDNSYPAFLAKMTGWNVENAGVSGISVSNWWKNHFDSYHYADYEIAIIELGYNGGLKDTLDKDVEPYSDYRDYADTYAGDYCKIIEGIREQNPDILIVLSISSQMKGAGNNCRKAIKKIAQRYDLPVIDLADNSSIDLNNDIYHGYPGPGSKLDKKHFNILGYNAKAAFIRHALTVILKNQPAKLISPM